MCKNPKCPVCNVELEDRAYGKNTPIFNNKNEFGRLCIIDKMGECPICKEQFIWQATFTLLENGEIEKILF